jgi:arylsulfatase A-like enzyme
VVWPNATLHETTNSARSADAVRTDRWKYTELITTGERELYDLLNDPWELQNLAGQPAYAGTQDGLRLLLNGLRGTP